MDEKQYIKMRAKAEEEYKKNLEAIDRVWHMSHPDKPAPATNSEWKPASESTIRVLSSHILQQSNGHKSFVLSDAVKEALVQIPDTEDISQPILMRLILERYPEIKPRVEKDQIKAQVAGMLSRKEKNDELVRVRESHGSEPAIFVRKFHYPLTKYFNKA